MSAHPPTRTTALGPRPSLDLRRFLAVSALLASAACSNATGPDACRGSATIQLDESLMGDLSSSDCEVSSRYRDQWTLTLASPTLVQIDLRSTEFDAFLELRSASGVSIAVSDDVSSVNIDSRIIIPLQAGTYQIVATSFEVGSVGAYSLGVVLGADCSAVGPVTVGESVTGTLGPSDCLFLAQQRSDNWSFVLADDSEVRLALASNDFEPIVALLDPLGEVIEFAVDDFSEGLARFEINLLAGTYTVLAAATTEEPSGQYELTLSVAPPCTPGTSLVIGTPVTGELDDQDCLVFGAGAADSWVLEVSAATPLAIALESTEFDPLILLRNSLGQDVAFALEEGVTGVARITMTIQAGTYGVFASAISTGGSGAYTLSVVVTAAAAAPAREGVNQPIPWTLSPTPFPRTRIKQEYLK